MVRLFNMLGKVYTMENSGGFMGKFIVLKGVVEQVLISTEESGTVSKEKDAIHCFANYGIQGDRHAGRRISCVREDALKAFGLPKGIEVANMRQFSAVSVEELAQIRDAMSLNSDILWGNLCENLVIQGIESLSKLPPNTKFFFESPTGEKRTAVLMVYDENKPCIVPGQNIAEQFNDAKLANQFPKASLSRRGVVGTVYCSGKIKTGDKVFAYLPHK